MDFHWNFPVDVPLHVPAFYPFASSGVRSLAPDIRPLPRRLHVQAAALRQGVGRGALRRGPASFTCVVAFGQTVVRKSGSFTVSLACPRVVSKWKDSPKTAVFDKLLLLRLTTGPAFYVSGLLRRDVVICYMFIYIIG